MHMTKASLFVAAAAALSLTGHPALADDNITLKVSTYHSATHFQVINGTQVWMDEVSRLTDGKVKFEFYPAGQLAKPNKQLDLITSGVVDIAEVTPSYVTEKLPLMGVLEQPDLVKSSCDAASRLTKMIVPGGTLFEADFAPNGLVALSHFVYPPYQVLSRSPIEQVSDFKGMKIRTTGGVMDMVAANLGGVSVRMSSSDIYNSLSRGTIDTVIYSFLSIKAADLQSIADYAATGFGFGAPSVMMMMNQDRYAALPDDVKDAMQQAMTKADQSFCSYLEEHEALSLEAIKAENGVKEHRFTDEQKAEITALLSDVSTRWAADLDSRGKPATQVIEEFTALGASQ